MADENPYPMLVDEQYMSLTTYRKSGKAVPTPVWFAQDGARLYVYTADNSGKVKRLRHTNEVEIAPCDAQGNITGERMTAYAYLHADGTALGKTANAALNQKYGLLKRAISLLQALRGRSPIFIEVLPAATDADS
jgi:uncharacterized protein